MHCRVCNSSASKKFSTKVLGKYKASFYYCECCGFLFTPDPIWLEEAYSDAIAKTDTGLVMRNIAIAKRLASVLYFMCKERGTGRYLDVAGGYGLLVRLMRDRGFDFYWHDKYCDNLFVRGCEFQVDSGSFNAVTAIEVLEHVEDPIGFIQQALDLAKCSAFIFTTALFNGAPPDPEKWWYYSFQTGQHISFFQRRTLEAIGAKLELKLTSAGGLHVLSKEPFNKYLMRICSSPLSDLIAIAARWRLGSLHMKDHDILVEQFKMNGKTR